jgi:hypothetical protein
LPPFRIRKREKKNERFVDFAFDPGRVGFCAGLAIAAHGRLYMSEASLSGRGQEEKTRGGRRSERPLTFSVLCFLHRAVINYAV